MIGELIKEVLRELEKLGFRVTCGAKLRGASGYEHVFEAVVEEPERGVVAVIKASERLGAEHVLPLLAHRIDLRVQEVVLAKYVESEAEQLLEAAGMKVLKINSAIKASDVAKLICEVLKGAKGLTRTNYNLAR